MEQGRPPSLIDAFIPESKLYRPRILVGSDYEISEHCELDGFLELEPLNSLLSKLSETSKSAWYKIFQLHAQQAAHLDATGNHLEAEALYHLCKAHLEQVAEELEGVDSSLALSLSWVYLALANLYRSSDLLDHWKATECLLSLLCITISNPAASTSISKQLDEIKFAICLTVLEWAHAQLVDLDDRAEGMLVALEEVRDVVEKWKGLEDIDIECFLAEKLIRGYEKLVREARSRDAKLKMISRRTYWSGRFSQFATLWMRTGEEFLDSLRTACSGKPFQNLPENMQLKTRICVKKVREHGLKAWVAANANHVLEAVERYQQCAAAVVEAGSGLPTSRRAIILQWVYEKIGHIYRFDIVDLEKAAEYYEACLLALVTIKMFSKEGGTEAVNFNMSSLRKVLIEIKYERAYDMTDKEKRENLLAQVTLEARKEFGLSDLSDSELMSLVCLRLGKRYEETGRLGGALIWNDERLKLMSKKDPSYVHVRIHSADLLQQMGDYDRASKILAEEKKKLVRELESTSTDTALQSLCILPYLSALNRSVQIALQSQAGNDHDSGRPDMTESDMDEEEKNEGAWIEKFLKSEGRPGQEETFGHAQNIIITKLNAVFFLAEKFLRKHMFVEAITWFHRCLELISELGHEDIQLTIKCHGHIATCKYLISLAPGSNSLLHFQEAIHHSKHALRCAEQSRDIYHVALYNQQVGLFHYQFWERSDQPLGDQAHEYLRQAIGFFCAAGRSLSNFLYVERCPSPLWISVQDRHAQVVSVYYYIQRSVYALYELMLHRDILSRNEGPDELSWLMFKGEISYWRTLALIWAERGHSRSLAFKLTERSMGINTRLHLKKFDLEDWKEAWKSLLESRDVCGSGTVMIEYIQAEEREESFFIYALFHGEEYVVDMQLIKLEFPGEEKLGALLTKLNNHMSQKSEKDKNGKLIKSYKLPEHEVLQILEDLYKFFISPIQELLSWMEERHKLVICANKNLAGVPFAALRNPDTKKFLIQRHTLMCTPSLRILKLCDDRLKNLQRLPLMPEGAALVLGDPAFEDSTPPLPFSGDEADSIATTLGHQNVLLLKGKDALKDKVLNWVQTAASAGKYQALLHLSTHGRGKEDNVKFKEGALEFADRKVKIWPRPATGLRAVSNLSDIAQSDSSPEEAVEEISSAATSTSQPLQEPKLEPAYQVGRGGPARGKVNPLYLTAEEVVKDYEWRMLLVVLSACETARGEVKSEGTLNLARALLISGVPCTVVSQWQVEDASTSNLMAGMYSSMVKGNDAADVASALRASMVRMIEEGFQVHQWAPFIVMGLGTVTLPVEYRSTAAKGCTLSPVQKEG